MIHTLPLLPLISLTVALCLSRLCPGDVISSSVKQILAYGKVVRPALGIAFAPDQSSESLGVKGEEGASMKGGVGGRASPLLASPLLASPLLGH